MGAEFISDVLQPLAVFGGIAMVIWASAKARLERRKLDMPDRQPQIMASQSDPVLAELKALKHQMAEMHSTSHQFDISFDEALSRMESRVSRLESKSAAVTTAVPSDTPSILSNGQSQ